MALANELDSPEGGPSLAYNLAYGRFLIYQNKYIAAIECLQSIVKVNCQVDCVIVFTILTYGHDRNVMLTRCWDMPTTGLVISKKLRNVLRGQYPLWIIVWTFSVFILHWLIYTLKRSRYSL